MKKYLLLLTISHFTVPTITLQYIKETNPALWKWLQERPQEERELEREAVNAALEHNEKKHLRVLIDSMLKTQVFGAPNSPNSPDTKEPWERVVTKKKYSKRGGRRR